MTIEEFEKNSWYTLTNTIKIPFTELSISHCGFEIKTNENDLIRNHYPAYRLHYIAKGSMYFYINGKEIFLPPSALRRNGRASPQVARKFFAGHPEVSRAEPSAGIRRDEPAARELLFFRPDSDVRDCIRQSL